MVIDLELARRLERVDALNSADYALTLARLEPASRAALVPLGPGYAFGMGPDYPINKMACLEFTDPDEALLEQGEAFLAELGVPARISFCPLGRSAVLELLARRGYQPRHFINLYVRRVEPPGEAPLPRGLEIGPPRDLEEWLAASRAAWELKGTPQEARFGQVALERPEAVSLVGRVEGQAVAVGAMRVREGIAFLNGAATAPAHRGRGIQAALLRERLRRAWEGGCEYAAISATPGSTSARNIERHGFRLAYTRLSLEKPR